MTVDQFGLLLGDQRWAGKAFNGQWIVSRGGARERAQILRRPPTRSEQIA